MVIRFEGEKVPFVRSCPGRVQAGEKRCDTRSHSTGTTLDRVHARPVISPLKNSISDRLFKNDEMQGARILRNEAYNQYVAMTKDEAKHRRSRF